MKRPRFLRSILDGLVYVFGSDLKDSRTGEKIARSLMFCWRGHIYLIGLHGKQVIPQFLPQEKPQFWKRKIGFICHSPPDFPHEPFSKSSP